MDGHDARFLRCYALYLAGEKRKSEELVEVAGPLVSKRGEGAPARVAHPAPSQGRSASVVNQELAALEAELGPLFERARGVRSRHPFFGSLTSPLNLLRTSCAPFPPTSTAWC